MYESYAADVYRFALWLTGDGFEAEDIASETFVRAWVHHDRMRTKTLKAYLLAIARNVCLMQGRKSKRQVVLTEVYPDPAPGSDKVVEAQQDLQHVRRILQTCSELDRAAFVLRVQHELSYAEIARVLDQIRRVAQA